MAVRADVLVVGGGIIGSGIAWALAERGVRDVVVLDLDLAGRLRDLGAERRRRARHLVAAGEHRDLPRDPRLLPPRTPTSSASARRGYLWLYDDPALFATRPREAPAPERVRPRRRAPRGAGGRRALPAARPRAGRARRRHLLAPRRAREPERRARLLPARRRGARRALPEPPLRDGRRRRSSWSARRAPLRRVACGGRGGGASAARPADEDGGVREILTRHRVARERALREPRIEMRRPRERPRRLVADPLGEARRARRDRARAPPDLPRRRARERPRRRASASTSSA